MAEQTVPAQDKNSHASALDTLKGAIQHDTVREFRRRVFSNVNDLESLRDWLATPDATGLQRGMVLWALGRHNEAVPLLEHDKSNPAIADCLAKSYLALDRKDDAETVLKEKNSDPAQGSTFLEILEVKADVAKMKKVLDGLESKLSPATAKYWRGRIHEMSREVEPAIACYDEALKLDPNHRLALFRLAVNVDLRGEDEEARELYERALMIPPVNVACVINLGILYEDMGNYRRAMQCFDLALNADPQNRRARMYRRDAASALNMYYDEDQERREDKKNRLLRTPINDFELSVRSRNCLAKMNIRTLGDLVKKTEPELLSYKNFGETSLQEIKEILRNKGLRLGMQPEELMSGSIGEPADETVELGEETPDPKDPDPSKRPITELDLSVRCRRIVELLKIKTIGDLTSRTESELLACPNFGQTSLNEIKTKLDELGLALRA